jgi:DNA primase
MSLNFNLRDRPNCKDVRAAIDIEVVVGRYLPSGKRTGKVGVARNPTRYDSKPGSFKVHLTHGYWSDFATNESGGDMIDLVVYLTGKTITEAKDELAAMFGVQGAVVRFSDGQYPATEGRGRGSEEGEEE